MVEGNAHGKVFKRIFRYFALVPRKLENFLIGDVLSEESVCAVCGCAPRCIPGNHVIIMVIEVSSDPYPPLLEITSSGGHACFCNHSIEDRQGDAREDGDDGDDDEEFDEGEGGFFHGGDFFPAES